MTCPDIRTENPHTFYGFLLKFAIHYATDFWAFMTTPTAISTVSQTPNSFIRKLKAITLSLAGIGLILWLDKFFLQQPEMPSLRQDMGFSLLLLAGFLSSFHCVGMCGPLIVSYAAKHATHGVKSHAAHMIYGLGKTLSYTLIGATLGAFGSIIAFTPYTQGMVGLAAGLFLILFGLHMLNVFPALRHIQIRTPSFLLRFIGKEVRKHHNPFVIGDRKSTRLNSSH